MCLDEKQQLLEGMMNLAAAQAEMRERNLGLTGEAQPEPQSVGSLMTVTGTPVEYLTPWAAGGKYWLRQEERHEKAMQAAAQRRVTIASTLEEFAERATSKRGRLGLLRSMAMVVVKDVPLNELRRRRERFAEFQDELFPLDGICCWLCEKEPATERHHVILIKHGGPELTPANIVHLCGDCHCAIHPWMYSTNLSESELTRMITLIQGAKEGQYTRTQMELEMSQILDSLFAIGSSEPLN